MQTSGAAGIHVEAPHPIIVCMFLDSLLFQPLAKPKSHSLIRAGRLPSRSVLSSFKSLCWP